MSKYAQFLLVMMYGFITITALVLVFDLSGIVPAHISDLFVLSIIAGWLIICFTSVYWLTDIMLFFMQLRKPIFEEEQRLRLCIHEIQKRSNDRKHYRVRIGEEPGLNAYAIGHNTIVVYKQCMQMLSDKELCALLAHEIGHLRSKDCFASMAFYVAQYVPELIARIFRRILVGVSLMALSSILVAIILLIFIFNSSSLFVLVAAVVGYVILLRILSPVFHFLWKLISRFSEYRQDAFAQKIGFGPELKTVLLLIAELGIPVVSRFYTITRSDHPILHNRIRRLEKLEGLRK